MVGEKFSLSEPHRAYLLKDNKPLFHWINDDDKIIGLLNKLSKENKQLKQENEHLNSEVIRLYDEFYCEDCLTCKHSKRIDITVRCAKDNGITDYQTYCDFYEIDKE